MNQLIFTLLLVLTIMFAVLADKKNNKFFLILTIIIPTIISGFRGINVGIDTPEYYNAFINSFPVSWKFEEIGFRYIVNTLMNFFNSPTTIMILFSSVINSLIILRLWDFREKANFPFMIFIYLFSFFIDSMNIMRQLISVAVIFFSTKLLEKKKYIIFTVIVLLLTLIHKASLLGLAFIIIYMWKDLSPRKKVALSIPMILFSVISLIYVLRYESGHLTNYFSLENSITNINITYLYRVFIFILSYLLVKSKKKIVIRRSIKNEVNKLSVSNEKQIGTISFIYFLGLIFSSMGMFYFVMARFGYFYLIYELIYWGYLAKNSKNKGINKALISVYIIYTFALELLKNGSGIFPYYMNFL